MRAASFSEVRTTVGIKVDASEHFFFEGSGVVPGNHGKGNYARTYSGALHGTVKVTVLTSGRISVRETGKAGTGRIFHLSPSTKVVVDGVSHTLDSLVRATVAAERAARMLDGILDALFD